MIPLGQNLSTRWLCSPNRRRKTTQNELVWIRNVTEFHLDVPLDMPHASQEMGVTHTFPFFRFGMNEALNQNIVPIAQKWKDHWEKRVMAASCSIGQQSDGLQFKLAY